MTPLKLIALDADDLEIISAHVQDAVLKVGDIVYLPNERRLVLAMNRFNWQADKQTSGERRRTVLHFERVESVRQRNIRRDSREAVLNLLAVTFEAGNEPGGTINLVFSGGGAIRLDVECIEARLGDLGAAWETSSRPHHEVSEEAGAERA